MNTKVEEAINYYKSGEYDKAIDAFSSVVETEEPSAEIYNNIGQCYASLANDEKAEDNKIVEESLFESLDSSNETYSTYSVCIINEQDSIDTIMEKYKVSRKDLEEYNNLNDLKIGTKLIIPSSNE